MKSAHRRAYIAKKEKKAKGKSSLVKILAAGLLILAGFIFFKLTSNVWNGVDKASVVYLEEGGDVSVIVLDPKLQEVTTLTIPKNTQVEVARNYGTFTIGNVWQLGVNEKLGGKLLAETVTNNFLFPTTLWAGGSTGLESGKFNDLVCFIFAPGKTNIMFGDRVKMALFSMKIQDIGRTYIDLGKSKFITKKILEDGQPGYVLEGAVSQRLTIYFADNQIETDNVKINITDATGTPGVADRLGQILEVLGGKVVSIDKKTVAEESDCLISGKNTTAVDKITKLFSCKKVTDDSSFDLNIKIGKAFAGRF